MTVDTYGVMTLRYNKYIRLKTGRYPSVGKFGDHIYAYRPVICSGYL
ncbi:hypothetical protein [Paenibacillus tuaregi]|nr:hypothetical protein [Paenibacillus tuaregi]